MSNRSSYKSTRPNWHGTGGNSTSAAIIVSVVIGVMLTVGLAVYLFLRWRARQTPYDPERRPRASMAVDRRHISDQITPYGSTSHLVPHLNHTPGAEMRIATRRPDGAWEFSNPGSPFNPSGVAEIEPTSPCCSTVPPTPSSLEPPKSPAEIMKESESKAARLIRQGYDDREFSEDSPPPPAYGQESGYLDHMSRQSTQLDAIPPL